MKTLPLSIVLCLLSFSLSVRADQAAAERGRWTFSAGPVWRSRVTVEANGKIEPQAATTRQTIKRDMGDSANWDSPNQVADPKAGTGGIPADGKLWGVTDTRTEIYGTEGSAYGVGRTETERPLGLNLQAGYDLFRGETWSVGLNLRFAGYWNLRSATRGRFTDSVTQTDVYEDQYVFEDSDADLPFGETVSPLGSSAVYAGETLQSQSVNEGGSRSVRTRFRGDLYQIGLGPGVMWAPFAGWCESLDWLGVYGGVEVLCNLTDSKISADGASHSQTDCLLGFGGHVGLVGAISDTCGIYGQVGYEWIDETEVSAGGFRSEIDYSSLVVAVGVQFRF